MQKKLYTQPRLEDRGSISAATLENTPPITVEDAGPSKTAGLAI